MTDPTSRLTVARGNNLVWYGPPSPTAAHSVLLGVIDRTVGRPSFLGLAPLEAVGEWARVAGSLAGGANLTIASASSPARLERLLQGTDGGLIVTSPETALASIRRAVLKPADQAGFLVLWPEAWEDADAQLTALFQDVPKETQRIFASSDPEAAKPWVERYAWRAALTDTLGPLPESPAPSVRSCPVSWAGRIEATRQLVEQLDPESVAVWTASELDQEPIRTALGQSGISVEVTAGIPNPAQLVLAYDLPTPTRLRELGGSGDLLMLVPPSTDRYLSRITRTHRPVHLRGALERAHDESGRIRREIVEVIERGPDSADLIRLAPLFEQYEATTIAAVLLSLLQRARDSGLGARDSGESPVRLWVSAGKRDQATPADLVAVLVRECGVPREAIGRIEIRDSFSLVEIARSAGDGPEQVAERLTGKTIRKRRLVARPDRPSPGPVERVAKRLPRPKDRGRT